MMKKNYNRDQFKRIFSFFAAVLLVGLYAAGFAWVWYESYSDAILLPKSTASKKPNAIISP